MTVIATDEKRKIRPTHPGEMLREDYLPGYDLTVARLALELQVSRQTVNELLRERRAVSPSMALRLSRLFGNSPEFWLNAQRALDLYETESLEKNTLDAIRPMQATQRCGKAPGYPALHLPQAGEREVRFVGGLSDVVAETINGRKQKKS